MWNNLLLNRGTRFHEACVPKGASQLLMTIVISQCNSHLSTRPLTLIDMYYIHGLHAPVRSIYWRTLHVRVPYPVHYASATNNINRVWVPSHPFTYPLVCRTPLSFGLLSPQPIYDPSPSFPLPVRNLLDVHPLL